jgi:inhibitor of KinA
MMWHIQPMGEVAVLAECSIDDLALANRHAVAFSQRVALVDGISVTLGINSVLVRFDPLQRVLNDVLHLLSDLSESIVVQAQDKPRIVEVPARYGGEYGPDLRDAAHTLGMPARDVVALHTSQPWRVLMIGFAPGFPYIGPLPPALHLPRRSTPRATVPAGSVAIAAGLTGIYPTRLPGGWHLIGRTDVELFNAQREPPAFLQAGDLVRFIADHVEGD